MTGEGPAEPQQRLPDAALVLWRLQAAAVALGVTVTVLGTLGPLWGGVVFVAGLAVAMVAPAVLWRRWRYEVRADEIDLRHGLFTVRRTLVPIRRVQHVDTSSGVLQGMFDLAAVSVHTAAGQTEIPALRRADAEAVRRQIGELARTRDDT